MNSTNTLGIHRSSLTERFFELFDINDFNEQPWWVCFTVVVIDILLLYGVCWLADNPLERSASLIERKMKLSPIIAAATLRAVVSSAPELATSLADIAVKVQAGLNAIVGSAIFNLLVIVGILCWYARPGKEHMPYYEYLKEWLYYNFAVIFMCFTLLINNGTIRWYNPLLMVLFYIFGYVLVLSKIERYFKSNIDSRIASVYTLIDEYCECFIFNETYQGIPRPKETVEDEITVSIINLMKYTSIDTLEQLRKELMDETKNPTDKFEVVFERRCNLGRIQKLIGLAVAVGNKTAVSKYFEDFNANRFKALEPGTTGDSIPIKLNVCSLDADDDDEDDADCCSTFFEKRFANSDSYVPNIIFMIISCILLCIFTVFIVILTDFIGIYIGIDIEIMSRIFLAAATSLPDFKMAITEAKKGRSGSAVTVAISSNTFDILVGLGLGWFISSIQAASLDEVITISLQSAGASIGLIFFINFAQLFTFYICNFKLTKMFGIIQICMYVIYLILTFTINL